MLKLNSLLTDNVVLPAEKAHVINGETEPGCQVTLTIGAFSFTETSDLAGAFAITVPPQAYGLITKMHITAEEETKEITVQYGDVFLFAGQSNMEYKLAQEVHFQEEQSQMKEMPIYFHNVPMPEYELKLEEQVEAKWERLRSDNLGSLSAVAY